MTHATDIMVIVPFGDSLRVSDTDELIAFSHQLQAHGAGSAGIWMLGENVAHVARDMADRYGLPVTALETVGVSHYLNDAYIDILANEILAVNPSVVCTSHTSQGWEWAPAVAARIRAGCICGADGITVREGRVCFEKETYGGKVKGLFFGDAATTVITVMPGVFKTTLVPASRPGPVVCKAATWAGEGDRARYVETREAGVDVSDIATAPVIVAVGNGIGDKENINHAHRLARLMPKAVVAGTRIICDRAWLGYNRQVGISGAVVAPGLYMACGISGASQHVTGMRGARFVVAVNTDPRAPMFNEADVCIVEDITRFLPLLADVLEQQAKGATVCSHGRTRSHKEKKRKTRAPLWLGGFV
jgi:electron transfer flavoprotein alpha subunit